MTSELKFRIPFPLLVESPAERVASQFKQILMDLHTLRNLHFWIALPIGWEIVNLDLNEPKFDVMTPIGLIRHPASPPVDIEVGAMRKKASVNTYEWAGTYIMSAGYKIVAGREINNLLSSVADILAAIDLPSGVFVARTLVVPTKDFLFAVQCRCKFEDYHLMAEDFLVILQSFRVATP